MATQSEQVAHADLVNGSQTTLHSHAGGGGADVKSGTIAASGSGTNSVTFNTNFSSVPQVVLTVQDDIQLRDCLFKVTDVTTSGFSFECDSSATYAWIATNAGNP